MCTRVRGRYTAKCYTGGFRATAEEEGHSCEWRAERFERNIANIVAGDAFRRGFKKRKYINDGIACRRLVVANLSHSYVLFNVLFSFPVSLINARLNLFPSLL